MIEKSENGVISKLPYLGISVFARMTALATQYQAVNLAQGFPDFQPPDELIEYLYQGSKDGFNQYAPMPGLLMLREQIKERIFRDYNYSAKVDSDITVTAGATQAIYTIISSFIRPLDKVLIFEPAYDSYAPSVLVNGGVPIYLRLKEPSFSIPWNEFENCINEHNIKLIIINNPHNPSGAILNKEEMDRIEKITREKNILIIWDEVYDLLVYDNRIHQSALRNSDLMQRSIVVFSLGKTLHNTGWKLGYIIALDYLTKEIRKLHQFTVFSVNTPAQYAVAKFMDSNTHFFSTLSKFYESKRDYFYQILQPVGLEMLSCMGSYFTLASFKHLGENSDEDSAIKLISEIGVACVPISAFYHDGYDPKILRFCFAKKEETLEIAAKRLLRLKDYNIFAKTDIN